MTIIVEDGTGVANANSYTTEALATTYLKDRGRQEENLWNGFSNSEREQFLIQATDFIEQRWGVRFLGNREFRDISAARATLTFTGQPTNAETVTIGTTVYTFNTSLGGANSILIGSSVDASIVNFVNAVAAVSAQEGTTHGVGTVAHADVTAKEGVGDTMIAEAKLKGTAGNGVVSTDTVTLASWSSATLLGGGDVLVPQPLSFPRRNLLDREGLIVAGIPEKLRHSTTEYAVRAASSTLMPDPTIDATGRAVTGKKEKIGPIEVETKYEEGGGASQIIRPYPAADRLLAEFIASTGRVIRG